MQWLVLFDPHHSYLILFAHLRFSEDKGNKDLFLFVMNTYVLLVCFHGCHVFGLSSMVKFS